MPNISDNDEPLSILTFRCEAPDRASPDGRCQNHFPLTHALRRFCCAVCQTRAYRATHPRPRAAKPIQPPRNRELKINVTLTPLNLEPKPIDTTPKPFSPKLEATDDDLFDNWLGKKP